MNDRRNALARLKDEEAGLKEARSKLADAEEAQGVLQELAQGVQQKANTQIAQVGSKCLSAVFENAYKLNITFERRRGKTEADFTYERDGRRLIPGVDSGGVLDVTSLSLRLASLAFSLPAGEKFLALDEPFRMVGDKNMQRVALLLEVLAREMGVQFLVATHNKSLDLGKGKVVKL